MTAYIYTYLSIQTSQQLCLYVRVRVCGCVCVRQYSCELLAATTFIRAQQAS